MNCRENLRRRRKSTEATWLFGIVPKWGNYSLSDVRTVQVEAWLGTLKQLSNGTRAKLRNIMSAIFAHALRWEFFDRNPITLVRQSAKRQREPEVLTVEELKALFDELEGIYRTMVFVGGVVGLRVSLMRNRCSCLPCFTHVVALA